MNNADKDTQTQGRAFRPEEHFRNLKGQNYLDCVWRVVWFREDHPDGTIDTEVVFWDHDKAEIMVRAVVVAPKTGARATAHCVCSLAEFKNGYCEKAETQAIGRALALLGYGTAFAGHDLEEGDQPADAPPSVARNGSGTEQGRAAVLSQTQAQAQSAKRPPAPVHAPVPIARDSAQDSAADWTQQQLGTRVRELAGVTLTTLAHWQDLARSYGLKSPAKVRDMTQEWLLLLYQAMQARQLEERIRDAHDFEAVRAVMTEAIGLRDRREISTAHYYVLDLAQQIRSAASEGEIGEVLDLAQRAKDMGQITQEQRVNLLRTAETRRVALSGPLTAQAS